MVSAPAAADAVERARRLPTLRVGLHVVLVEGSPVLPPEQLPNLVDKAGRFRTDLARLGIDIFARPAVRRQVRAEIEAQFRAFKATGLALDHVNAHKHFHLHPTIAREIIAIAVRYGARGLRVPIEPRSVLAKIERDTTSAEAALAAPWARLLARRVRAAGLRAPDTVLGLAWSGAMSAPRLAGLIQNLPFGATEIYMHPATAGGFPGHAPGYRYADEFAALTNPAAMAAARTAGIKLGGYADMDLH
jgi:hopanoid biosynthesis associated protein HpnK